jgi:hypothetical protein
MHRPRNSSYRSLEELCRQQAALSTTPAAREELESMAREYAALARWQEYRWPEESPPTD